MSHHTTLQAHARAEARERERSVPLPRLQRGEGDEALPPKTSGPFDGGPVWGTQFFAITIRRFWPWRAIGCP